MAYIYMNTNEIVANVDSVQWEVDTRAVEIGIRAENLLADHRVDHVAEIDLAKGDVDAYVVLVDSNITNDETAKSNTALSIEFGRAGWIDENGETWGAMDGLHILTRAAHLPNAKGPRVPKKRRNRPTRTKGGRFIN